MNWSGIGFILTFVVVLVVMSCVMAFLEKKYLNRKNKKIPKLREYKVRTYIKCSKCDYKGKRNQKLGDYVFKDVGSEFSIHDCKGTLFIEGIYCEQILTKKEKKWLKLEERWR